MSRPWQPTGKWLRPEAYDALSPAEKRALWHERNLARHNARFAPRRAYRKGYYARQRLIWLVAVMLIGAAVGTFGLPLGLDSETPTIVPTEQPPALDTRTADVDDDADRAWERRSRDAAADDAGSPRSGSAPNDAVRASFATCKSGGGYNCVVDGDTIYLSGQKIRIAGIDAPETHDYGCASELALGERAAARLHQLVNSGAISLSSIDRDEDKYGRKLRNVAVDGRDVGHVLVSEGLAREYGGGRRSWCS